MPIYLDENMMGADPNLLAFPHLLVCMGLVCVTDGQLLETEKRTQFVLF